MTFFKDPDSNFGNMAGTQTHQRPRAGVLPLAKALTDQLKASGSAVCASRPHSRAKPGLFSSSFKTIECYLPNINTKDVHT